jgi:hypothetical protein
MKEKIFPSKYRILKERIKRSSILILLPIAIIILIGSIYAYTEAKSHLTPASVSVRGYYRRNGTYVNSYHRRPPGGAQHDRPYENTMDLATLFILAGGSLSIFTIYRFVTPNSSILTNHILHNTYHDILNNMGFVPQIPKRISGNFSAYLDAVNKEKVRFVEQFVKDYEKATKCKFTNIEIAEDFFSEVKNKVWR